MTMTSPSIQPTKERNPLQSDTMHDNPMACMLDPMPCIIDLSKILKL